MNRTADEGGVTVSMAATSHLGFFEAAIGGEYLAEIVIYEMPVQLTFQLALVTRRLWLVLLARS